MSTNSQLNIDVNWHTKWQNKSSFHWPQKAVRIRAGTRDCTPRDTKHADKNMWQLLVLSQGKACYNTSNGYSTGTTTDGKLTRWRLVADWMITTNGESAENKCWSKWESIYSRTDAQPDSLVCCYRQRTAGMCPRKMLSISTGQCRVPAHSDNQMAPTYTTCNTRITPGQHTSCMPYNVSRHSATNSWSRPNSVTCLFVSYQMGCLCIFEQTAKKQLLEK